MEQRGEALGHTAHPTAHVAFELMECARWDFSFHRFSVGVLGEERDNVDLGIFGLEGQGHFSWRS